MSGGRLFWARYRRSASWASVQQVPLETIIEFGAAFVFPAQVDSSEAGQERLASRRRTSIVEYVSLSHGARLNEQLTSLASLEGALLLIATSMSGLARSSIQFNRVIW